MEENYIKILNKLHEEQYKFLKKQDNKLIKTTSYLIKSGFLKTHDLLEVFDYNLENQDILKRWCR